MLWSADLVLASEKSFYRAVIYLQLHISIRQQGRPCVLCTAVSLPVHQLLCIAVSLPVHQLLCAAVSLPVHQLLCAPVSLPVHQLLCTPVSLTVHQLLCTAVSLPVHQLFLCLLQVQDHVVLQALKLHGASGSATPNNTPCQYSVKTTPQKYNHRLQHQTTPTVSTMSKQHLKNTTLGCKTD